MLIVQEVLQVALNIPLLVISSAFLFLLVTGWPILVQRYVVCKCTELTRSQRGRIGSSSAGPPCRYIITGGLIR